MMLREVQHGRHVSDDGLQELPNDPGRTTKSADAVLERQNAELRARNDLLEEEIRQLRKTLAPRLLFPLSWHLNRGETSVLACLYVSPDGFRSSVMLRTCAETFSADSDGAKVVSVRIFNLRNKLRPFGIRIITRHGEGYVLPPDSHAIIEAAVKKESA
jgi:DNA-binding response OmpR family regulator